MQTSLCVLHVDDDAEDRWLFQESLLEVDATVSLKQFEDGRELLDFLAQSASNMPAVHLIICDMQMAQMGGIGLLEAIKQLPAWQEIPVIIFSTSSFEQDIRRCLEKGAAAFFTKPATHSENLSVIQQMISHYSLRSRAVPTGGTPLHNL